MLRNNYEHRILYHPKLQNVSMEHIQHNRRERSDNCSKMEFHFEPQHDQDTYIQMEGLIHKS